MEAFSEKQRRIEPAVRKAPKYRQFSGEAKKKIFEDIDLGVSVKQLQLLNTVHLIEYHKLLV